MPVPETPQSSDHATHASWWPPVAAFGAAAVYGGIALALLGVSAQVIPPVVGISLAVGGGVIVAGALVGWVREAYLAPSHHREEESAGRELHMTTMVLFLATDLGTFGSVFAYYGFVRVDAWPPADLPSVLGSLVLVNTLVLLISSATFHVAHRALERGRHRRFLGFLGATVALGIVFLIGQVIEYYEFVVEEGFTLTSGVYASAFFGLTGLHAVHVTLGVVLLAIVLARALRGHYGPEHDTSVATVGLYWHFVDVVWIVLVLVLYVGAEGSL